MIKKVGKFIKECLSEKRSDFSEWKCNKCGRTWITGAYHINHKGEFE